MPSVIHPFLRSKDLYNHWEKRDSGGEREGRSEWQDEEERPRRQRVNERTHAPHPWPGFNSLAGSSVRNRFKCDPPR